MPIDRTVRPEMKKAMEEFRDAAMRILPPPLVACITLYNTETGDLTTFGNCGGTEGQRRVLEMALEMASSKEGTRFGKTTGSMDPDKEN
jgi:hypothetical protein